MPRTSSPPPAPRRRSERGPRAAAAGRDAPPRQRKPGRDAGREAQREVICVCGLAAVAALFATDPGRVERLIFEPRLAADLAEARRALARRRKPYREADADELARVAGTVRHGGVVAVARPRPLARFGPELVTGWARDGRPLLILDGIGNPHNLGAIVRTAAFFG